MMMAEEVPTRTIRADQSQGVGALPYMCGDWLQFVTLTLGIFAVTHSIKGPKLCAKYGVKFTPDPEKAAEIMTDEIDNFWKHGYSLQYDKWQPL